MNRRTGRLSILLLVIASSAAFADTLTEKVQQTLKDQGFYYGEITGTIDTDTTAAIRRYQIRNGLKITGQLDVETQKALGVGGSTSPATPAPTVQPRVERQPTPAPDTSDLRTGPATAEPRDDQSPPQPPAQMNPAYPGYAPAPPVLQPQQPDVFAGTPYETAPPDFQRRVIAGAQAILARRDYYRSELDGVFGPGTELALRAFQSAAGLPPTGRLDMQTLTVLRLLPRHRRGFGPRVPPFMRPPPAEFAPDGEPIYEPR